MIVNVAWHKPENVRSRYDLRVDATGPLGKLQVGAHEPLAGIA